MSRFSARYVEASRFVLVLFVTAIASLVYALLGIVIIGTVPSIAATFGVYRRWALSEDRTWTI